MPKGREGDIAKIFEREDEEVPPIRSGMLARPGHVLIEADFKSAELFTLAWLADDPVMKQDLAVSDLHSTVACTIFKLPMTVQEFEKARKADTPEGKRLTGLRIAAKSVNFG